jgi:hypothetical protein
MGETWNITCLVRTLQSLPLSLRPPPSVTLVHEVTKLRSPFGYGRNTRVERVCFLPDIYYYVQNKNDLKNWA